MTVLDFDGIPFDALAATRTPEPAPLAPASPAPAAHPDTAPAVPTHSSPARTAHTAPEAGDPRVRAAIGEIRAGVVAAHRATLAAQVAIQRAILRRAALAPAEPPLPVVSEALATFAGTVRSESTAVFEPTASSRAGSGREVTNGRGAAERSAASTTAAVRPATSSVTPTAGLVTPAPEPAFKPLARTSVTRLDSEALHRLADGDIAGVFGPSHRRGTEPGVARLASTEPLTLTDVESIELRGGDGKGRLVAGFDGDPRAAAVQAAEVFALFTGMHLGLSRGDLVAAASSDPTTEPSVGSGVLELLVGRIDLVPRPHVTGVVRVAGTATALEVSVAVVERDGTSVGPGEAANGLLLNEFHMVHLSRGDQTIAMGPEFAEYTGVRATRLPTGGLLLVDRVLDFDGARGRLDSAAYTSEYDSPADSWYYADTANDSMPHFVYMETSLQAALLMGYYAGPTLTQPGTTLSLRNLGGKATVLRQIDLRDKTIEQSSRLLSTTILPGSSLQTFDYTLSVDGEPFYVGETMFGYFSDQALANQTGLDAGRTKPSWLAEHSGAAVREIDVAARRADPSAPLCARRNLTLIDRVTVVDGGGEHGAGYLHSLRTIDPSDWYFARHFHLDPVIPGSLGVESVIHAVQEWMIDAGFADTMADPVFRIPRDIAFSWRYRGQFLPSDGTVELEAHVKSVRREPHGVVVTVDGSLWKPGLRIYELIDLAIELVDRKASR
ncbi:beta-hydroxydecanoyl-ACP dehydratase [Nocardia bovistercoris]|uniref:Beta-ketoacyl synthase n=1 Tax=Nocardia bovistercoris TaxID=2785916 RepID=A0A931IAZ7_9NOCA|nr:beta-hydroxydecanoyl-ACP dehydratase [Nocardia bovistercoris]MBH0776523.1 beta-ketoacyl synthase [Nocardia bovistercoris]